MKVVSSFGAGSISQHVVPGWDLKTLYVTASAANQLVPIDPTTGQPGRPIPVTRPYNLYFSPDGTRAIVQAEENNQIDYYDTATWTRLKSVPSTCKGNNHADWSADSSYFVVTCEFSGDLLKVDTATGDIVTKVHLPGSAMPQDVRLTPDGSKFYVADMMNDGLWVVDGTPNPTAWPSGPNPAGTRSATPVSPAEALASTPTAPLSSPSRPGRSPRRGAHRCTRRRLSRRPPPVRAENHAGPTHGRRLSSSIGTARYTVWRMGRPNAFGRDSRHVSTRMLSFI